MVWLTPSQLFTQLSRELHHRTSLQLTCCWLTWWTIEHSRQPRQTDRQTRRGYQLQQCAGRSVIAASRMPAVDIKAQPLNGRYQLLPTSINPDKLLVSSSSNQPVPPTNYSKHLTPTDTQYHTPRSIAHLCTRAMRACIRYLATLIMTTKNYSMELPADVQFLPQMHQKLSGGQSARTHWGAYSVLSDP